MNSFKQLFIYCYYSPLLLALNLHASLQDNRVYSLVCSLADSQPLRRNNLVTDRRYSRPCILLVNRRCIHQSNLRIDRPVNHPIDRPCNLPIIRPVSRLMSQQVSHPIRPLVNLPINLRISLRIGLQASLHLNLRINRHLNLPFNLPLSQRSIPALNLRNNQQFSQRCSR